MAARPADKKPRRSQRGSTALEFGLVMVCAVPLLFGTMSIGITLGRGLQAVQITRDVGHMYGLGADFSASGTQSIAATLAQGFNLTSTGNAVLIFSQIITLYQADCTAATVSPCTNVGDHVVTQRIVVGNSALHASAFATPLASYMGTQGNIPQVTYMKQPSVVVTGFPSVIVQADGDIAYIVEGYFTTPDLNFLAPGFTHNTGTGGVYARAIF